VKLYDWLLNRVKGFQLGTKTVDHSGMPFLKPLALPYTASQRVKSLDMTSLDRDLSTAACVIVSNN